MEHRWNPRKRVEIEVALHVPDLGVIRARARDISYGGMCIETRPWILDVNKRVRVIFADRIEARAAVQGCTGCSFADRIEARAARQGWRGCGLRVHAAAIASLPVEALAISVDGYRCGLMFADLDHDTVTFLRTFLRADVPSAPLRHESPGNTRVDNPNR